MRITIRGTSQEVRDFLANTQATIPDLLAFLQKHSEVETIIEGPRDLSHYRRDIREVGLTAAGRLSTNSILHLGDLMGYTAGELRNFNRFGSKMQRRVVDDLAKIGLALPSTWSEVWEETALFVAQTDTPETMLLTDVAERIHGKRWREYRLSDIHPDYFDEVATSHGIRTVGDVLHSQVSLEGVNPFTPRDKMYFVRMIRRYLFLLPRPEDSEVW